MLRTARVKIFLYNGLTALALLLAAGCCENSTPCRPAAQANAGKTVAARGEVDGEVVYNLGQNVYANSNSVTMAGGAWRPTETRLPGGLAKCCPNTPPAGCVTPAPAAAQPTAPAVAVAVAAPKPNPVTFAGICPPLADSAGLCLPGDNLGACYTLSEEAEKTAPELYRPAPEPVASLKAPESIPAPLPPPEPILAAPPPNVLGKYEHVTSVEALAPPPDLTASVPVKSPPALPARTEKPAVAAKPPAVVSAPVESFPPIPEVTDMEAAVDALLSRDAAKASNLPEVQLPPKLN